MRDKTVQLCASESVIEDFYSALKVDHQEDQINEMVEAFRAFMLIKDKSSL